MALVTAGICTSDHFTGKRVKTILWAVAYVNEEDGLR